MSKERKERSRRGGKVAMRLSRYNGREGRKNGGVSKEKECARHKTIRRCGLQH